jgi:hypothetical protein
MIRQIIVAREMLKWLSSMLLIYFLFLKRDIFSDVRSSHYSHGEQETYPTVEKKLKRIYLQNWRIPRDLHVIRLGFYGELTW